MIKRKMMEQPEKTEKRAPRQKKVKVDLSKLPDAIVDGKFVVPVKGKVFFERTLSGTTKVHEGTVVKINENGVVDLFDDTVEQFYSFSLYQKLPNIKASS